jgi:hypothetical protein
LYESIGRPKDAAMQFQLAARLALGERPTLPGARPAVAATAPADGVGSIEGGSFPSAAASPATLSGGGVGAAAVGAAGAAAAGMATAYDNDADEGTAATAGDVGAVPAIARPDRQDARDRTPPAGASDLAPAPPSDAAPAVDLEAGAGDEVGLVGRKE